MVHWLEHGSRNTEASRGGRDDPHTCPPEAPHLLAGTHLGVSSPSLSSKHSATSSGVSTLS